MFKSLSSSPFGRAACLIATVSLVVMATGCTDEEIDASLDGIVAGLEIVAIADGAHCVGEERTVCQDSPNYYGVSERVCRTQYDSCARLESDNLLRMSANSDAAVADIAQIQGISSAKLNDVNLAQAFGLRFDSAARILDAIKKARAGDRAALVDIGMSADALQALGLRTMPSDESVDSMARALNQSPEVVKGMLARVVAMQQQQAQQKAEIDAMNAAGGGN